MSYKLLVDSVVALITPFNKNNAIDYQSLEKLLNYQLQNGTSGIIVSGTTGESSTLSRKEKVELFQYIKNVVKNKVPLVLGTGSNNTESSIQLTQEAEKLGADGVLVVCPYYNKPTQKGLYYHFKEIAQSTNLPIYLYNVPSRTSCNLELETIYKLAEINNIVGIKDAVNDLSRAFKLRKELGENFLLFSGEDETFLSYLASGGNGCISVSANIIPNICSNIHNLFKENKIQKAIEEQTNVINLHSLMFCESNPVPVKYALYLAKIINNYNIRLPLYPLEEHNREKIKQELQKFALLK